MRMIDRERIEKAAVDIYAKHYKRGVPAKVLPNIISAEGIKYREVDGAEKFLGALVKSPKDMLYICINKSIDNKGRKNFTIAHEALSFLDSTNQ